ncbi:MULTISPECIES: transcriptional regulator [Pseudomonas]|uniref:Transcriptional regulator n=2 Tax=Pseudomonas TaxID=286 RepID=A0A127I5B3_PSEAZ|nr:MULTISPECIES: transcriptional regulator [Pseudomonas]AMN81897.1 transcriptional regulator [Pseudomonas azotoformans]NWA42568.1 transcriptional regulator [Pseudomonas reactans]NWC87158.1 transcriptional regulator [Pseudomonas reactans]NWD30368.1 transcriptional regulator [Pseudomonas reactans]NWD93654.1 transcriptional regulator [Pseudomonas reactans]
MEQKDLELIDVRQLPHSLQVLIACVGLESAFRLTCVYGGRPKYIPKHSQRTSLALVLSPESLQALIDAFAGISLEIPKSDHFFRQIRNQNIQTGISDGISRSVLAEKYGLSLRQIANIRRQEVCFHR